MTTIGRSVSPLARVIALFALMAASSIAHAAIDKCVMENPATWPLRFTLGTAIELQQCQSMCRQGGGNGYACVSAPVGTCLCGTATKPASTGAATPTACTSTCAGSGASCGGPGNAYTCYTAPPPGPCPAAPSTGCTPGAGSLRTRVPTTGTQRLRWRWRRGAIALDDLGNPSTSTTYHACLYADGRLIDTLSIAPGAAWSSRSNGDLAFRERGGNADGVTHLTLHASPIRGRIWLEARGTSLDLTRPPLAYASSVTMQLRTDAGACWESAFPAPARNDDGRFSDRISRSTTPSTTSTTTTLESTTTSTEPTTTTTTSTSSTTLPVVCPGLPLVANGVWESPSCTDGNAPVGRVCTVSCNPGYTPNPNNPPIVCQPDGTWIINFFPTCE